MQPCCGHVRRYGGSLEMGPRQMTLSDLYSIDISKFK